MNIEIEVLPTGIKITGTDLHSKVGVTAQAKANLIPNGPDITGDATVAGDGSVTLTLNLAPGDYRLELKTGDTLKITKIKVP
jgi:hypothetical protein